MLSKDTFDRIVELGQLETEPIMVDGRPYAPMALHPVIPPTARPIEFTSLEGLASYILDGPDNVIAAPKDLAVHVMNEGSVEVISGHVAPFYGRHTFASATPPEGKFPMGRYLAQEDFIIGLQSLFEKTEIRDALLLQVGSVTGDEISISEDDGVSQRVTAKAGVQLSTRLTLPNPVDLQPFRTFREVQQPVSKFILRVRKGITGVELALFEADGGVWKLEAMTSVATWLRGRMSSVQVLA